MAGALVGIVVGSDSDLAVMQPALRVLAAMGVPFEVDVCSAHRTPERTATYARRAAERGLEVIIAGAGKAAHLPGVLASLTMLPVVGVPLATPPLGGLDALYSIVQMPTGVPVAAVGIDAAENAALLAVRILARRRPELTAALEAYARAMRERVEKAAAAAQDYAGQAVDLPPGKA